MTDGICICGCAFLGERERVEIIHGEAFLMASPSRIHQKISFEISRQLGNFLEGKRCEAYSVPFGVRLFEREGDRAENVDTVVEPDISIVCVPNSSQSGRGITAKYTAGCRDFT